MTRISWLVMLTLCIVSSNLPWGVSSTATADLPERPSQESIEKVFGFCGKPLCHITSNGGGVQENFLKAAEALLEARDGSAEIDGDCISGCTVFAAAARERVCITARARMGFHKGYVSVQVTDNGFLTGEEVITTYEDPVYPADLLSWLREHNGLPYHRLFIMQPA